MLNMLWLIPVLPFAGFCILVMKGPRLPKRFATLIGAGSVGLAALLTILVAIDFISSPPMGHAYSQTLWTWMDVAGMRSGITFFLDPLSLVMIFVITLVGFLIHIYSIAYMKDEEGYSRYFAFMNLFVGAMLTLVLADNLVLLYLGWEGVGLCSYLLIGFWYRDPVNGYAARKAFVVTRVGDVALALGIFLLFKHTGTVQIQDIMKYASGHWQTGTFIVTAAAFLLLGGAVGKSAQLPLQTWLPDAMAGPTPVSALIHAATMVTAGVYLIARTNVLFTMAPSAQTAVAVIGAATLLLAGCSAFTQRDIKRVLAYSTISQIGYMFLALGVGAWSAAVFHFMVHAFFKALLFLGAGVIILSLDHERDIFKMGGLHKRLPLAFWTFLIGSASLSALPLVTAGFYSKELILWQTWSSPLGNVWLWIAGTAGAFVTSLYTFRMVFLVFFGDEKTEANPRQSLALSVPLIILAVLSIIGGFVQTPETLGGVFLLSGFMSSVFPASNFVHDTGKELLLQIITSLLSLSGVYTAYIFFLKNQRLSENVAHSYPGSLIGRFWSSGWGFDGLYDTMIVRPFLWITCVNKADFVDLVYGGVEWYSRLLHRGLSISQSGNVRWYASVIAFGAVLIIALVVFL